MKARRYCSRVWLAHSVCPSVCGSKAVDKVSLVSMSLKSICQNLDVNLGSLSDTITRGRPWSQKTVLKKMFATSTAVAVVVVGWRWTIFESRSMNTTIALYPSWVGGSLTMKSIVTCSHYWPGVGSGCRRPAGSWEDDLIL